MSDIRKLMETIKSINEAETPGTLEDVLKVVRQRVIDRNPNIDFADNHSVYHAIEAVLYQDKDIDSMLLNALRWEIASTLIT